MNELPKSITELAEPSEYLREGLATPPRWVIRWGETLVLVLVILLLALGWLIRYPDRIPAQVIITTWQPPVPVKARTEGALTQLLVSDNQAVAAGQLSAELGYWVGQPYWGRGYATEAARRVIRYGFEDLMLNRIEAYAMVHNGASFRIFDKLGMQQEGYYRQMIKKEGAFVDVKSYAILQSEYTFN